MSSSDLKMGSGAVSGFIFQRVLSSLFDASPVYLRCLIPRPPEVSPKIQAIPPSHPPGKIRLIQQQQQIATAMTATPQPTMTPAVVVAVEQEEAALNSTSTILECPAECLL